MLNWHAPDPNAFCYRKHYNGQNEPTFCYKGMVMWPCLAYRPCMLVGFIIYKYATVSEWVLTMPSDGIKALIYLLEKVFSSVTPERATVDFSF